MKRLSYVCLTVLLPLALILFSACNKLEDATDVVAVEESSPLNEQKIRQLVLDGLQDFPVGATHEENLPVYEKWLEGYQALSAEEFERYIEINAVERALKLEKMRVRTYQEEAEEIKSLLIALNKLSLEHLNKPYNQVNLKERALLEEMYGMQDADQSTSRACATENWNTAMPITLGVTVYPNYITWRYKDNNPNAWFCDREAEYSFSGGNRALAPNADLANLLGGVNAWKSARYSAGRTFLLYGRSDATSAFGYIQVTYF